MPVANPGNYALDRSLGETMKLNLQHFYWKKHFGYLIHPRIPRDKPDLKIADVGTGTGIWLFDMADDLPPTATLDGFDIDLSQAPHPGFWPKNVRLRILDALEPIPDELAGQYDIVNLRFFVCVIRNNDPTQVIQNLKKLLKPGGWLQWCDVDKLRLNYLYGGAGLSSRPLRTLRDKILPLDGRYVPSNWVPELPASLEREGLVNVGCHEVVATQDSPTWGAMMQATVIGSYVGIIRNLQPGPQKDDLEKALADVISAMRDGVAWAPCWMVCTAQKPNLRTSKI